MEKSTKVNLLRKKRISDLKIFEDSCIVSYKNEQEINISYFWRHF